MKQGTGIVLLVSVLVLATIGVIWSQDNAARQKRTEPHDSKNLQGTYLIQRLDFELVEPRDPKNLLGKYQISRGERDGEEIAKERLEDIRVHIKADTIVTYDGDENETYAATYKVDSQLEPWTITLVATRAPDDGEGTTADGLVAVDGDVVKLIYALPGGATPTEFKTVDGQQLFEMQRITQDE